MTATALDKLRATAMVRGLAPRLNDNDWISLPKGAWPAILAVLEAAKAREVHDDNCDSLAFEDGECDCGAVKLTTALATLEAAVP